MSSNDPVLFQLDAEGVALAEPCYDGPADSEGVGPCHAGTRRCDGGVWGACFDQVIPRQPTTSVHA